MGQPQAAAVKKVKDLLSEAPTLAFYDATKQTTVSADVNSYGLGGVLLQITMDSSSQSHTAHVPLLQQKRGMPRLRRSARHGFGLVRSSSGTWWA